MKKSMIMMCIAALLGLYIPATASEPENTPPVKQEIRVVKKSELAKYENKEAPAEVTPVTNQDGEESTTNSNSAHSGYIVISGAGLLLLIILLIILL